VNAAVQTSLRQIDSRASSLTLSFSFADCINHGRLEDRVAGRPAPIYGLEYLGVVPRGEAGAFISGRNTAPGGKLPLNTNGGGLSYMHSGMYGMYALQESVRQMCGTTPAQIPGARISVCHGVGGMFAASGTLIVSNEPA
jgi:hypothetical protein